MIDIIHKNNEYYTPFLCIIMTNFEFLAQRASRHSARVIQQRFYQHERAAERPDRTWQKAEWTCNMQCTKINVAALWWCASIFLAEVKSHKHNKGLKFCEPGGGRQSLLGVATHLSSIYQHRNHMELLRNFAMFPLLCNYHKCFLCCWYIHVYHATPLNFVRVASLF